MFDKFVIIVTIAATFSLMGTMLGATIGIILKKPSKNTIGSINAFAAGLMLSIVILDLIPEAFAKTNSFSVIIYSLIGLLFIVLIEVIGSSRKKFKTVHSKVAFMAAIGLMIHNFPEGIIMGIGFLSSGDLGVKMSLLIAIHDIPEGIAVAAPLMAANKDRFKILAYAFITAFPTLIGGWLGIFIGNISSGLLGACLSIASSIMLYVIFCEMIPEALNLCKFSRVIVSILIGSILGLVITILL